MLIGAVDGYAYLVKMLCLYIPEPKENDEVIAEIVIVVILSTY